MIKATTETASRLVAVGGGMAFPDRVVIDVTEHPESPFDLTITVEYSVDLRRYWLCDLRLRTRHDDAEITMRNINKLTLQEFVTTGLSQLALFDIAQEKFMGYPALSFVPGVRGDLIAEENSDTSLRNVYLTYRIGEVLNEKPTKHMAQVLGVPYATGADWLGKARRTGIFAKLDDTTADSKKLMQLARTDFAKAVVHGDS